MLPLAGLSSPTFAFLCRDKSFEQVDQLLLRSSFFYLPRLSVSFSSSAILKTHPSIVPLESVGRGWHSDRDLEERVDRILSNTVAVDNQVGILVGN